jgi:NADH:ubiquinone oxidoreductase subunit 5 (subunit L)/multisubunit Na+/H+ antiporter MnhA subunit
MLVVVSFVSLMVHIYTIGYMSHDKDYTKFFTKKPAIIAPIKGESTIVK